MTLILNENQIKDNWEKLLIFIEKAFPTRKDSLLNLYSKLENRISIAPASSKPMFHNAFPGGYVDHVIRVIEYSKNMYELWKKSGIDVSEFLFEELLFSALNHDLGKIGFEYENGEYYVPNPNQWEIDKKQAYYSVNGNIPWASVPDLSIYLLQSFNVNISWNEFHAIKLHDGLYDEANKPYYLNNFPNGKFKTPLPWILHYADMMAMRYEYQEHYLKLQKIDSKIDLTKAFK